MIRPLLLLLSSSICPISSTEGFLLSDSNRPLKRVTITAANLRAKISGEDSSPDLSWLQKAMDTPSSPPDGLVLVETKPGLSGFAADPERGFVAVFVGGDRATYSVVSPKDKNSVRSPEALCLVQLAGGLDLGTPVLPPDLLAKLVAEEIGFSSSLNELRYQAKLERVDVVQNDEVSTGDESATSQARQVEDSSEREASIQKQAPKVAAAVKNLPGLEDCTLEQTTQAMQLHASDQGEIDRTAFMALLKTLRETVNAMEPSRVKFILRVSCGDEKVSVTTPSTLVAVGLALRYNVDFVLSKECQRDGFDVVEIASRFPSFRPIQELLEDAKIMDGFIPSMFTQATAPKNDDKV